MKLDGQVAIITGAGRGIGRAIALAYAREGARLALAARNEAELEETAAAVSELGGEAITVRTDVTSQIATERLARRVAEHYGRIDVLVNNAGISGPVGPLESNDIAEWVDTINVNLTGTFLVCRAVISRNAATGLWQYHQPVGRGGCQCLEQHVGLLLEQKRRWCGSPR